MVEGTPFGPYRLLDLLGRGGMGEVWRAYDTVTDRTVAIKVLPPHLSQDADYQRRFRKEARAAARLANPHVIPIHTHGDVDGRLFLDMRLIEGRNLDDVIGVEPLEPARAVSIVEQIADALQAAHAIGLVHRDIKPSNVLLADNDFAYLIDFGIAKVVGETGVTGTGDMIGSCHYMAPERLTGDDAGPSADVYSLACVLFECLTGARPFPGDSLESQVGGHMLTSPPRASEIRSTVPAAFDDVIATGMAKNPSQRYSSATDLARAARAAVEPSATRPVHRDGSPDRSSPTVPAVAAAALAPTRLRPVSTPSTATSSPAGPRRRRAFIAAAAAVVAVITIVVGGYAFTRRGGDTSATTSTSPSSVNAAPQGVDAFDRAKIGDCMYWMAGRPDLAEIVDCADDHRFEVTEAIDMSAIPGADSGPDAAPPTPARIQQISQEQCAVAARQYLGTEYDPNSRFAATMVWPGETAWRESGARRILCGLQLPGLSGQQFAFKGRVAELDQSRVWSACTCLGIDPETNQPTDVPADCSLPHAMEVTGTVDVGARFPNGPPSEAEQDGFIKGTCTKLTDEFLAPIQLRSTALTLVYSTVSPPSWTAGSRQVSCSLGAVRADGTWSTLVGSARGQLLIDGQPPVPQ